MSEVAAEIEINTQALLFDMDGVLISSIASADRCWPRWGAIYNVPGAESLKIRHGTRAVDLILGFKPEWADAPDRDALITEALRTIEDLEIADVEDLKVLPGVRELLQMLPTNRWTIVTSATRRLLEGRLRAAKITFPEKIVVAEDVVNGKPHPEPYMRGASILGFDSAECVVVEDAPAGVGSGKAAGSRVLAVLTSHNAEQLYAAGADWVIESLADMRVEAGSAGLRLHLRLHPRT